MLARLSAVALEVPSAGSVLSCLIEKSANGKTKFRETFNSAHWLAHIWVVGRKGIRKSPVTWLLLLSLLYYQPQKLLLS